MKKLIILISSLIILMSFMSCSEKNVNILVFTKANGFKHAAIQKGAETVKEMEKIYPFKVTVSDDSLMFSEQSLKQFDVALFMNTTGNILGNEEKLAFQNFIRNGGGFVGVHAASDTEHDWDWFDQLVGTHFSDHPRIQKAKLNVLKNDTPSTKHLPKVWEMTDEWYNWKHDLDPSIEVLITIDETTYEGGKHGDNHPISWRHEFEGGKVWFTALGHVLENFDDENFIKHLAGGIKWAASKY